MYLVVRLGNRANLNHPHLCERPPLVVLDAEGSVAHFFRKRLAVLVFILEKDEVVALVAEKVGPVLDALEGVADLWRGRVDRRVQAPPPDILAVRKDHGAMASAVRLGENLRRKMLSRYRHQCAK